MGKSVNVVRAAILAAIATGGWGCYLDRTGLNVQHDGGVSSNEGGVSTDGRAGAGGDAQPDAVDLPDVPLDLAKDLRPDLGVDVAKEAPPPDAQPDLGRDVGIDVGVDAGMDVAPPCDTAGGFHRCGEVCVSNMSTQTCGSSCSACAPPANATATCNGTSCGYTCNLGFAPQGSSCLACNVACDAAATTVTAPGGRFTGKTSGASTSTGSCGGGAAPEAVYRLVLTAPADVFVTTHGTDFNTVLYMRRGTCCGAEVACNNDADSRSTSVLAQQNLPAGTYYIFVDGAQSGAAGNFTVDIYTSPPSTTPADTCGRPGRIADKAVSGDTRMLRDDFDPPPLCIDVTNSAFDAVYYFVLDVRSTVQFSTCNGTCIDTILYIRDVCSAPDTASACNDDDNVCGVAAACTGMAFEGIPSTVSATLDPGVHYLILDTYPNPLPTLAGPFTITPVGVPP